MENKENKSKMKVGIIGCGAITEYRHAPEYANNPYVEIIAFCDPVPGRAEHLKNKFGGKAYVDYECMLKNSELDAVSVCTSNDYHSKVTINALKSNIHVLCEKPMATSLKDAKNMIETAKSNDCILMIGHNQRLTKAHQKAKEILESGQLGKIMSFKTSFAHSGPENWSVDKGNNTWFFKKNKSSLGVSVDLGIHKADLIRWFLDDEIDTISAYTSTVDKAYESGEFIDVEDNIVAILRSKKGIIGTLAASWTNYGNEDNDSIIYCQKGTIKIYVSKEYPLIIEHHEKDTEYYDLGNIQTNNNQTNSGVIDSFVSAIINKIDTYSSIDGYEALSIVLSCYESAKKGKSIKVKHFME